MRFFFLHDFQHWLLAVFLGLVLAILIYVAFRSYGYSAGRAGFRPRKVVDYPDGLKGGDFPVPPFIIFLCLGILVWAICYVIFIGIYHGPI